MAPEGDAKVYVLKTTINQERSVAMTIAVKARDAKIPVYAVISPSELRGYVLIESSDKEALERLLKAVQNKHARGLVKGETKVESVEHFLTPKPTTQGVTEGDIVELVSGPFKGEKARVQRIDEAKEEITVELFEAVVPIPVTVRGDHVRVLQKK